MAVLFILALVLGHLAESTQRGPDAADGSLLGEHSSWVQSVAFDPKGRWIASAAGDGLVYVWDWGRRELAMCLPRATVAQSAYVYCLALSPDGSILAAANSDGSVAMWDVARGTHRDAVPNPGCATRGSQTAISAGILR